ncbi:MAG TPA: DUF996 domain-containing protein [Candidatus Bathyarchaeia archaeon]
MALETNKNLAGVGAILIVISVLATFRVGYASVLLLIGAILLLIGMKGLADDYHEPGIFNNALYAVILVIVGVVAVGGVIVAGFLSAFSDLGLTAANWAEWSQILSDRLMNISALWDFLAAIVIALVLLFVFVVVSVVFFRKSLSLLSAKSGIGLFGTAGLLMLIGAILTIIVIGFLLIWIGLILAAVAFFMIRPQSAQPPQATSV